MAFHLNFSMPQRYLLLFEYQATLALDGLTEETHKLTGKPVDMHNVADKIDAFRKRDVLVHGFFVIGMPGEKIVSWRRDYNKIRPHSSFANRTPEEF
jgi:hypothetical protein